MAAAIRDYYGRGDAGFNGISKGPMIKYSAALPYIRRYLNGCLHVSLPVSVDASLGPLLASGN